MKLPLALTLLTLTGVAIAQDAPPPGPSRGMTCADANGDGVVTKAEFTADNEARFARMDANHDGKLDASELPQRRRGGPPGGPFSPPPRAIDQ